VISSVSIREATAADNILLSQLGWQTFAEAFAPDNTPADMAAYLPSAFSPALQAAELADPRCLCWIVYMGETPIGYVKLYAGPAPACISQQNQLKIARLYLLQAWWGQGIGPALLERSINYAQEQNYYLIWLTVWEKNMRALKLYQKFGFAIVGEEEFVLGQDVQRDYIMEKVL